MWLMETDLVLRRGWLKRQCRGWLIDSPRRPERRDIVGDLISGSKSHMARCILWWSLPHFSQSHSKTHLAMARKKLHRLPYDILLEIFSYLDMEDLRSMEFVNKTCQSVAVQFWQLKKLLGTFPFADVDATKSIKSECLRCVHFWRCHQRAIFYRR